MTVTEYTKNGVKVRVERTDSGSVVLADCDCFGHPNRCHSTEFCPNLKSQMKDKNP